jgi:hypothetical protein
MLCLSVASALIATLSRVETTGLSSPVGISSRVAAPSRRTLFFRYAPLSETIRCSAEYTVRGTDLSDAGQVMSQTRSLGRSDRLSASEKMIE